MRLSIIRVNWEIWPADVHGGMFTVGMRSCAIVVHFRPRGFALPLLIALPLVCLSNSTFCRFICLLLVQECFGGIALCFFHSFGVSSAVMPPRDTRNSLESSVVPVSSAPASTISVMSIAIPTSMQVSGTSCFHFARIFSLCDSGHPNSNFSYRTTVVSCRGQRSFSFSRLSHHCCPRFFPCCSLIWMHVAFINLGLHWFLLGFCSRLLHPVLLQYQWLWQRTYYQVCCRLLSSHLSFLWLPCLP